MGLKSPAQRYKNNSSRALPPPASAAFVGAYSKSKLQTPSRCRSARSTRTKICTPTQQRQIHTPADYLRSVTDDRSATSELSSVLHTPKTCPDVPDWELECK